MHRSHWKHRPLPNQVLKGLVQYLERIHGMVRVRILFGMVLRIRRLEGTRSEGPDFAEPGNVEGPKVSKLCHLKHDVCCRPHTLPFPHEHKPFCFLIVAVWLRTCHLLLCKAIPPESRSERWATLDRS